MTILLHDTLARCVPLFSCVQKQYKIFALKAENYAAVQAKIMD